MGRFGRARAPQNAPSPTFYTYLMSRYFNDSPIETASDDRYGIAPFANSIATSILNIKAPEGTTIALHGPWGSGKSSAVNLIRSALDSAHSERLVVTEFKVWWYRGEEALALAFLQNLHATLSKGFGDKIKKLVPKITRRVLQAGPVIGAASSLMTGQTLLAALVSKASDFASTFFSDDTVEDTFNELAGVLKKSDKRFLVIIDDIDRLTPEEALAIFRLVKSVGRLPNVMYLLVFDRALAEKLVLERYPSEGPHFLEKIIQAGFELPLPLQTDLNEAVLASVQEICGVPDQKQMVRFMNIFYDVVAPYITTPRHVGRLQNALSVTWAAVTNDVNIGDFLALETLRLNEPTLFNAIRVHKSSLCGATDDSDRRARREGGRYKLFLQNVPEKRHDLATRALQRLFPRMEDMGYGSEFISRWDAERRVCVETHFDTYFRLALSDDALPSRKIDELVERADDRDFIQSTFRQAAATERKGNKSMVPVYLDELTTHAERVEKQKVKPLLTALFEIHDEIDLEKDADSGFMAHANTTLRFNWLMRRLTKGRFSIDERTDLYLSATERASLAMLVFIVNWARDDYVERTGKPPSSEEDCLVTKEAVEPLTARALDAIRTAANDGTLIKHRDVAHILYRWRNFTGNQPNEVRGWTDRIIDNDSALVALASAMTGKSWSMGMGGLFGDLGDRVARSKTVARIDDDQTDILDVGAFRAGLERVRDEGKVDPKSLHVVRTFLEAWDRQRSGEDD